MKQCSPAAWEDSKGNRLEFGQPVLAAHRRGLSPGVAWVIGVGDNPDQFKVYGTHGQIATPHGYSMGATEFNCLHFNYGMVFEYDGYWCYPWELEACRAKMKSERER